MYEMVIAGGWVMAPLLLCSVVVLTIAAERYWTLNPQKIMPPALLAEIWGWLQQGQLDSNKIKAVHDSSPLGQVLAAGLSNTRHSREVMIESMEIAFRMQTATPELLDISSESEATKKLYGVGNKDCDKNARACLLARRLSEAGVRFVQVTMGGWDHHGDIRNALPKSCAGTDQPCAALIKDLKSRGLLEDTLVIWSGEFGRTPWSQDLSGTSPIDKHGREHQPESFCTWLAGGARYQFSPQLWLDVGAAYLWVRSAGIDDIGSSNFGQPPNPASSGRVNGSYNNSTVILSGQLTYAF